MSDPARDRRSRALQNVAHCLIGFGLLIKGWEKLEHFGQYPLLVIFLFFAGLLIISGAALHDRIEKKIPHFSAVFHVLEGLALIAAAIILLEKKGSRIPYFLLFIGVIYIVLGTVQLLAPQKDREKYLLRLQLVLGIVFLAAAVLSFVLNILRDGNVWMYVMAAVLAAGGIGILVTRGIFKHRLKAPKTD